MCPQTMFPKLTHGNTVKVRTMNDKENIEIIVMPAFFFLMFMVIVYDVWIVKIIVMMTLIN